MSTAFNDLQTNLSTPEGQKAYLDWVANPMTFLVLAASRELARPRQVDFQSAPIAYGECMGANRILDFIANPIGLADGMRGVLPPARYGARAESDQKGEG